jgi:putative endonuclease
MNRTYCIYILASRSRNLYIGVTGNLESRMVEHRQGLIPGFTTRYRVFRLVHFELFHDIHAAIAREKEIKGWRREKKIWLIERGNPTWVDLAEKIPHQYQRTTLPKQIPHPRSPKPCDRVRDDNIKP